MYPAERDLCGRCGAHESVFWWGKTLGQEQKKNLQTSGSLLPLHRPPTLPPNLPARRLPSWVSAAFRSFPLIRPLGPRYLPLDHKTRTTPLILHTHTHTHTLLPTSNKKQQQPNNSSAKASATYSAAQRSLASLLHLQTLRRCSPGFRLLSSSDLDSRLANSPSIDCLWSSQRHQSHYGSRGRYLRQ